jgi:hypothetical protein
LHNFLYARFSNFRYHLIQDVYVYLKTLHHFFLLGHVSNTRCHVLQTHRFSFCVALFSCRVYDLGYFLVNLLKNLDTVSVPEPDPQLVLVI